MYLWILKKKSLARDLFFLNGGDHEIFYSHVLPLEVDNEIM